ncbi:hypothetical protein N7513_003276 [Penicillium frequentans]|uniref:Uncharacterized protein n=1 Tax=Penicillium frequentans TaxID=3151616 RepID=A0AAD6CJ95_9EURO|nr:hypothetical protein N7494_013167 [Penicillium glabrum]KAJ5557690.1 hypothetical protein N7513_003276 [Penicillium glabrum]
MEGFFETFTSATDLYTYTYRGNNTGKSVIVGYDWNGKKTARVEAVARRAIPPDAPNIRANSIGYIRHLTKANISA